MQISQPRRYQGFAQRASESSKSNAKTWQTQIDRWTDAPPVLGTEGDIVVTGLQHRVYSLDASTGETRWEADAGDLLYQPPVAATDETLIYNSHAHGAERELVLGIDSKTGETKWSHTQNRWGNFHHSGDTAYTLLQDGFSSLNVDSGKINWTIPVENEARSEPVLSPDGNIYLCEDDPEHGDLRHFSKLNSETGAKEWGFFADDSAVSFSPKGLLGVKHHKYGEDFEPIANQFEVRSPETGEKLWTLDRMGLRYTTQFTEDDRVLVTSFKDYSDPYQTVESRDAATGEMLWQTNLPTVGRFDTTNNGLLVTQTTKRNMDSGERYGHNIVALDPETGEKRWGFNPDIDEWQRMQVKETGLYFSGRRNIEDSNRYRSVFFALDEDTGEKKWEYDAGLSHWKVIEDPENRKLYLTVGENKLVCLDAETGRPEWHMMSDIAIEVGEELTPDGRVLVADLNGNVAAISAESPLAIPGDVPQDPDTDHGIPIATRGYGGVHMMEAEKLIQGEARTAILTDHENDGVVQGWESVLVRDVDGDGEYTNEDLEALPNRDYLNSLDLDANNILVGEELRGQSLAWWRDRNDNGLIDEDETYRDREEKLYDLERFHETTRY